MALTRTECESPMAANLDIRRVQRNADKLIGIESRLNLVPVGPRCDNDAWNQTSSAANGTLAGVVGRASLADVSSVTSISIAPCGRQESVAGLFGIENEVFGARKRRLRWRWGPSSHSNRASARSAVRCARHAARPQHRRAGNSPSTGGAAMNPFKKPLQVTLLALVAMQLSACSRTVEWQVEVPLNTGETIWVKHESAYKLQVVGGNPLDLAYQSRLDRKNYLRVEGYAVPLCWGCKSDAYGNIPHAQRPVQIRRPQQPTKYRPFTC